MSNPSPVPTSNLAAAATAAHARSAATQSDPPPNIAAATASSQSPDAPDEADVVSIPLPSAVASREGNATPTDESSGEEPAAHFWLRHSDQLFLGAVVIAMLVLMICHWVRLSGWGLEPVEIERLNGRPYEYRIDVNDASWIEWTLVEGIGETLARRIVADREQNGPFQSIDDLNRVKGIGPKTLERIRPQLKITPPNDEGRP